MNGGVTCDADVDTGSDGVERFYYPTREGNTLVALDTKTGLPLKTVPFDPGITPWMLTTAPDHKTVWVMEDGSDTNSVLDLATLAVLKRFPKHGRVSPGISSIIRAGDDSICSLRGVVSAPARPGQGRSQHARTSYAFQRRPSES